MGISTVWGYVSDVIHSSCPSCPCHNNNLLTLSLLHFLSCRQLQVEPMPLINGTRRRFVDDSVLPPVQAQQTYLDKIQAQRRKQEADALLEAIELGECLLLIPAPPSPPISLSRHTSSHIFNHLLTASDTSPLTPHQIRRYVHSYLYTGEKAAMTVKKDHSIAEELFEKQGTAFEKKMLEAAKARDAAMKRTFLKGAEKVYGKGRLTSTHNSYGHFDPPWEFVGSKYKPLPGVGY